MTVESEDSMTQEGLKRLRHAVCHEDPDPTCQSCVVEILARMVQLLMEKHEPEAYREWTTSRYNQFTVGLTFLQERARGQE